MWVRSQFEQAPIRTLPILCLDANTQFGHDPEGLRWEHGVEEYNLGTATSIGQSWKQWLRLAGAGSATTHNKDDGPTYFGVDDNKPGVTIDHVILSDEMARRAKATISRKCARSLQLMPHRLPKDHVPSIYEIPYTFAYYRRLEHEKWDYNKLARCLQRGIGRQEFLDDLNTEFGSIKEELVAAREQTCIDEHWETIVLVK